MIAEKDKDIVIEKHDDESALNFSFLRSKAIELVQQYSGKNWSDFNLHDPGVTILEYVCYALTDVAYRTLFPITDILADKFGRINREKNSFLCKEEALTTNPVTKQDFRKVLIDAIPEIDNVWLEPITSSIAYEYTKGLYHVIIKPGTEVVQELARSIDHNHKNNITGELIKKAKQILISQRNIGDHFESFTVLEPTPVHVKAEVVIERSVSPQLLLAKIYHTLETSLNPPVVYQSEMELLSKGISIEDIYAGPLLRHGIIPDSELKDRIRVLDLSILTKAISSIDGVISVKQFAISEDGTTFGQKSIILSEERFPLLIVDILQPDIKLFIESYPLHIKRQDSLRLLQKLRHSVNPVPATSSEIKKNDDPLLDGIFRNPGEYISIQTLFPAIYRISEEWIENNQPAANIAKSRQLKAYLMFFEQVIANAVAQLANLENLFSTDLSGDVGYTYHFQPLYNVPDAKYILKAFTDRSVSLSKADWDRFKQDESNGFVHLINSLIESDDEYKRRKKRAFNHLLARFNIAMDKHPVILYGSYYDKESIIKRIDLEIEWKAAVLKNLESFTASKAKAFNYLADPGESVSDAGFEKKMAMLLHIKHVAKRSLSGVFESQRQQIKMQEKASATAQEQGPESMLNVRWRNEELNIVFDKTREDIEEDESGDYGKKLFFKNQSESLFQCGIDLSNYRIGPYTIKGKEETVILYKNPQENMWRITSIHPDQYAAMQALRKTIEVLKSISIESEGFHILEHILLKPSLKAEQFGFHFIDVSNKVILKHSHWLSFGQREKTVEALLQVARQSGKEHYSVTAEKLKRLCTLSEDLYVLDEKSGYGKESRSKINMQSEEEGIKRVINSLLNFVEQKTNFYPSFEYIVRQPDKKELKEDFFNFRITVIFPSWPARFQDKGFREFAKNLFREECPAHLRMDMLWLPVGLMKNFEHLYFDWLKALKEGGDHPHLHSLSNRLISFLMEIGGKV